MVSTDIFVKVATPGWVMKYAPTERMKRVTIAFEELEVSLVLLLFWVIRPSADSITRSNI